MYFVCHVTNVKRMIVGIYSNSIIGSAVCVYNLTAIDDALSGPFKYQETSHAAWSRVSNHLPPTVSKIISMRSSNKSSSIECYSVTSSSIKHLKKFCCYFDCICIIIIIFNFFSLYFMLFCSCVCHVFIKRHGTCEVRKPATYK